MLPWAESVHPSDSDLEPTERDGNRDFIRPLVVSHGSLVNRYCKKPLRNVMAIPTRRYVLFSNQLILGLFWNLSLDMILNVL